MPEVILFDVTIFRAQFPAFANPIEFPDAQLQMYWDMATCYISDLDYGVLHGRCRRLALDLMTAHLTALSVIIADGQNVQVESGSSIDKISVTLQPPPLTTEWKWWLSTTPYGLQLSALLSTVSVGGLYVSVSKEMAGFRKIGGGFIPFNGNSR